MFSHSFSSLFELLIFYKLANVKIKSHAHFDELHFTRSIFTTLCGRGKSLNESSLAMTKGTTEM
jgi:hypothetical protein